MRGSSAKLDPFKNVQKSQLQDFARHYGITFPDKIKKQDIIPVIKTLLTDHVIEEDYYRTFSNELALHPVDLQKILKCTKAERLRWTEQGKLSVLFYRSFTKYGKTYQCPYYDRQQAETLSAADIKHWRDVWKQIASIKRSLSSEKAAVTRKINADIRQQAKLSFNKEKYFFLAEDIEAGIVFSLCFWTQIINRWAKQNIVLARNATKRKEYFESRAAILYSLKNRAVKVLQHSKYANLSFYRPKNPDKIFLVMCDEHYACFRGFFNHCNWTPLDEYNCNPKTYDSCPDCSVERIKDYYSLFFLRVTLPNSTSFSFHTPYDIGKTIFPNETLVTHVSHQENEEEFFRFGCPVTEDEIKKYPEAAAVSAFNDIYFVAEKFFAGNYND